MTKDKLIGILAAVSANAIFGLNIPVTKALIAQWMTPTGYTITRMFFGSVVFWSIASLLKKEKVAGRDFATIIMGGLLGYLGTQFLFSKSLEYTTPVIFALLIALTPVAALLLSAIFLRERVSIRKITGIILSISGAFLVILEGGNTGSGTNPFLGVLLAILCVFLYAGYLVMTRKVAVTYSPVTVAKWMFLISALVLLPLSPSQLPSQAIYSGEGTILAFSLLGFALLFSTTLAFFCLPLALKKLEASTVTIFMNLQPLVASVVAIAIGQDTLTWDKGLAALLVLSGVYLVSAGRPEKAPVAPKRNERPMVQSG